MSRCPMNGNFSAIKSHKNIGNSYESRVERRASVHLTEQSALWNGDVVAYEECDRTRAEEVRGEDGSGVV